MSIEGLTPKMLVEIAMLERPSDRCRDVTRRRSPRHHFEPNGAARQLGQDSLGGGRSQDEWSLGMRASCLVADGLGHVPSGKARNMIAAWRACDSEFIAFCDADIALDPDHLSSCMRAFTHEKVGAVFAPCLFDARDGGGAGRMVMHVATLDKLALLVAGATIGFVPCIEGGLMVFRRSAVEAAGGVEVIADALADDQRLGRALRRSGFWLRMSDRAIAHRTEGDSWGAWARRYHRWMLCHRAEGALPMVVQMLLHPIVVPTLVCLALTHDPQLWALVAASAVWRTLLSVVMNRHVSIRHGTSLGAWVLARLPADVLHFAFCVAAWLRPSVAWCGRRYSLGWDGRIADVGEVVPEVALLTPARDASGA